MNGLEILEDKLVSFPASDVPGGSQTIWERLELTPPAPTAAFRSSCNESGSSAVMVSGGAKDRHFAQHVAANRTRKLIATSYAAVGTAQSRRV